MEKLILISLTILGFFFCLDFGYILTGYGHGGQLLGIPFAIILTVFSALTIFTKHKTKIIFRILTYGFFLTMLSFTLTVLSIRHGGRKDSFSYLYSMDGIADKLFLGFCAGGLLISLAIIIPTIRKVKIKND